MAVARLRSFSFARHLHGIEAEALFEICAQSVGETGVICLLVLRRGEVFALYMLYLLHGTLVWQCPADDMYVRDDGFMVAQARVHIP